MRRDYFDRQLTGVPDQVCGLCDCPEARPTGKYSEMQPSGRCKLEVECPRCTRTSLVAAPDDPLVRRILQSRTRPDPTMVSGEIGEHPPAATPPDPGPALDPDLPPPLLRILDAGSATARVMRRDFSLTVDPGGLFVHEVAPSSTRPYVSSMCREVLAPDLIEPLRRLITAAVPRGGTSDLGRGHRHITVELQGTPALTVRWAQHGTTREFGGDPRVTRQIVELVDGFISLAGWIDARDHETRWTVTHEPHLFPRVDDLLRATPAARLTQSHDWDGSKPSNSISEVWVAATGVLEHRTVRTSVEPPVLDSIRIGTLSARAAKQLFTSLAALQPHSFRPAIGCVHQPCHLDRTHHHTFTFFDGARLHHTDFVFGSERGIGVSTGDTPPTAAESKAFNLLADLEIP